MAGGCAVGGVRAQGGAQLRHHGGGAEAVADDVADASDDAPAGEHERVVPVAAEALAARRQVAAGQLEAGDIDERLGQQPPLQRLGETALLVQARACSIASAARSAASCSRSRSSAREHARDEAADVQDADHPALDQQRDAEQRADALLAQDRVEDVGVVDVLDRRSARRSAAIRPAKPLPTGMADALHDLLLDPLGGAGAEHSPLGSSRRIAAVSLSRISVMRCSSSASSSSSGR